MFSERKSQSTVDRRQDPLAGFLAWFECDQCLPHLRPGIDLSWILFDFMHAFQVQVLFSASPACCSTAVRFMYIGRSSSTAL